MSCYLRHLEKELDELGIDMSKADRRRLDQAVHRAVGVDHKDCPRAWKEVKRRLAEDRKGFLSQLEREYENEGQGAHSPIRRL